MSEDLKMQLALAHSRAERLKIARNEAELLLEQKSRELYEVNQRLQESRESLVQDIEHATSELSVSNERLKKALDEKSIFLGKMSHEVRTPLNAIIGLSEILLTTKLDESQLDYLTTISNGGKALIVLIDDMLDITKIEAGRINIRTEPANTKHMLRNIIGMFSLSAEQQGLNLSLRVGTSVPNSIRIDVGRYTQIVNNLISNAIKNTSKGRIIIDVSYRPDSTNSKSGVICTKVADTGVGIEPHQIEKIFDAYEQVGRPTQGSGLGLAICQQLCALLDGDLRCKSVIGKGSIFTLELPVKELFYDALADDVEEKQSLPSLPPLRILAADDNPINQKVLSAQLAQLGQSAHFVGNGQEALDSLEVEEYDVIILDIMMPVLDGEQTLKKIRESNKSSVSQSYCVALTASSYENQKARLLRLGFDGFLSKPLSLFDLGEMLKNVPSSYFLDSLEQSSFIEWDSVVDTIEYEGFDFTFLKHQFGDAYRHVFNEIAPIFLVHAYQELEQLVVQAQANDVERVRELSHSLKGAASSVGLSDLVNILLKIENEPDASDVISQVSDVQVFMQHLKPVMEAELAASSEA